MTRPTWDDTFMDHCRIMAARSKDPSTQVGAVIVGPDLEIRSSGYNGPPRRVNDARALSLGRPEKYYYMEHAERNAIYNAKDVKGCTIYTTEFPCAACTRGIIQSGITKIIVPKREERNADYEERWADELHHACSMLMDAEIRIYVQNRSSYNGVEQFYDYFRRLADDTND